MSEEIVKAQSGTVARQEFGAQQIEAKGETVATVLAARAKAEVEARFVIAMKRPRDWLDVRAKLLRACERPGFAGHATEKIFGAAWFKKPIGSGVEGFSIRFAEEVLRCMGNMDARSEVIWEDSDKRIVQVTVMDLESNISIPTTLVIEKLVEKSYLKDGQVAIKVRTNSRNEPVYLVDATPDEVLQRQNALTSKAIRNGVLRLLPGDIQAECRERILDIRHGGLAKDPDGFAKKVVDWFATQNIKPSDLEKYLGHNVSSCTKAELAALHDLAEEIKSGNTTWHEIMKGKPDPKESPKNPMDVLTDKLKKKTSKKKKEEKPKPETASIIDPREELLAVAKLKYGDRWQKELRDTCEAHEINSIKMSNDEASMMLDILNQSL